MSLPPDYKALVFLGAIAVLGAGVRVSRAASHDPLPSSGPYASAGAALERQMQAADSAARAARAAAKRRTKKPTRRTRTTLQDTGTRQATPQQPRPKLDLDVATAAQIDSLPRVTPTLAKRIVADRLRRGPFLSLQALRRVRGAGPALLRNIDSLVTFSGIYAFPNWDDTVIPRRVKRARTPRPP